jgi:hypothetical protein
MAMRLPQRFDLRMVYDDARGHAATRRAPEERLPEADFLSSYAVFRRRPTPTTDSGREIEERAGAPTLKE